MLVQLHVHSDSAKGDAFHLQAESLLSRRFAGTLDRAAGTDDPVPGQSGNLPQDANDLPGRAGPTCCFGHRAVGRNGALWESADAERDPGAPGIGPGLNFEIG